MRFPDDGMDTDGGEFGDEPLDEGQDLTEVDSLAEMVAEEDQDRARLDAAYAEDDRLWIYGVEALS